MKALFFKLLKTRSKDYLLVILSGIFIISLVFFTAGVESCMIFVSTGETAGMTALIMESEKAFLLSYVLLVALMILTLLSYIRKRVYDYSMLEVLGIQKKHKYMFVGFEYLGIILGSVVGGVLVGVLEVEIIRRILEHKFTDDSGNIFYGWSPFLFTLIISLLIFGLGFMICDQMISCLGIDYVISMGKKSGKKIQRSLSLIVSGVVIMGLALVSIVTYWGKIGSIIPFALAAGGLFLFMISVSANYLHMLRKREQKYLKKILWLDSWYDQFFYHMNVTCIVAVFVFVMLFGFGLPIMDNVPVVQPEIFPYDLVWYANEQDMEFLNKLEEAYEIKVETKPCIRVVSGDYGEHMGIPESVYEDWTGKKIDIRDKEIYVIYQRDRETMGTIGLDYGKSKPRIYIGSADWDIWNTSGPKVLPSNQFTRKYKIAGEEQRILTGDFESRALGELKGKVNEEILVFSDTEFANIKRNARGANLAVMMEIPKHYNQVVKEVYNYAKVHSQVNFFDWQNGNLIYEKQQSMMESRQEKLFTVVSMIVNVITMLMCVIFILFEKAQSDYSEMEWKYRFYKNCGMSSEKRRKSVCKEVLISERLVLLYGISLGMLAIVTKILFKGMSPRWSIIYLVGAVSFSALIALIVCIVMRITAWRIFRKIERNS
ncbi:MAG: FtsX-like permease family protein [Lachnospiraceae bacterium]|nr:FtsX-like permease family protein [Lachnospiraceae bacterium]